MFYSILYKKFKYCQIYFTFNEWKSIKYCIIIKCIMQLEKGNENNEIIQKDFRYADICRMCGDNMHTFAWL